MSMLLAEIFARMKRKRINPVPARSINYNHRTNMVISNLIPFPKLNLICAFDFVVMSIVKLFNPTQMGVPKLSLHGSILLFLLLFTNSEARSHFKRKLSAWSGRDLVEVVELQQQHIEHRQATNPQQSHTANVCLPNQPYQESVNQAALDLIIMLI